MNRIQRGFRAAISAALLSNERYRVGAAIFLGNRLLQIGWNSKKTSPRVDSVFNWHHAETAALIGSTKSDLTRATIYVVRVRKSGTLAMARPCKVCRGLLRSSGIKKVVYSDRNGKPKKLCL